MRFGRNQGDLARHDQVARSKPVLLVLFILNEEDF